jgi:hypothetical protein
MTVASWWCMGSTIAILIFLTVYTQILNYKDNRARREWAAKAPE